MRDIFLSYNREDQPRAKVFADAFAAQGFNVWWDVGLKAGEAYDEVTETALRTAKAVVVLWSKKSVQSRWVRAEAMRRRNVHACDLAPAAGLTASGPLRSQPRAILAHPTHWRSLPNPASLKTDSKDCFQGRAT